MGYKQMDRNMTFAEVDLMTSMDHNRSLKNDGKDQSNYRLVRN